MPSDDKRVRARVLEMARKDERRGDWKSALRRYRRLTGLEPDRPSLHVKLGDVCLRLGEPEAAADAFLMAGSLFGRAAFDDKAAAACKRALDACPRRADARDALVEAYRRLGRTRDAVATLERATRELEAHGDRHQALALRQRIAGLDPSDVDARLRLARDLDAAGRREDAVSEYAASALELLRQGDFARVEGVFDALVALRPEPADEGSMDRLVDRARLARAHFQALGDLYRQAAALHRRESGRA